MISKPSKTIGNAVATSCSESIAIQNRARLADFFDLMFQTFYNVFYSKLGGQSTQSSPPYVPLQPYFFFLQGVYCLQYDDDKIVSGLRDNTIKIWDRQTLGQTKVRESKTRENYINLLFFAVFL